MDIMGENARDLEIPQGACGILGFIICQETFVDESIMSPDCKLIGMLIVYTTDDVELLACKHIVSVVPILRVEHFLVRLNIPIVIILNFNRCFIEDLSWANVIDAAETTQ